MHALILCKENELGCQKKPNSSAWLANGAVAVRRASSLAWKIKWKKKGRQLCLHCIWESIVYMSALLSKIRVMRSCSEPQRVGALLVSAHSNVQPQNSREEAAGLIFAENMHGISVCKRPRWWCCRTRSSCKSPPSPPLLGPQSRITSSSSTPPLGFHWMLAIITSCPSVRC